MFNIVLACNVRFMCITSCRKIRLHMFTSFFLDENSNKDLNARTPSIDELHSHKNCHKHNINTGFHFKIIAILF